MNYIDRTCPEFSARLSRIYGLLTQVQPIVDAYDVSWDGPWFIPRAKRWYPTWFMLYRGTLYAVVSVGGVEPFEIRWVLGSEEVGIAPASCLYPSMHNDEDLWLRITEQIEGRLRRGLKNPAAYNRHVARHLPEDCRTGYLMRRLSWPVGHELLPVEALDAADEALARGQTHPPRPPMTVNRYMEAAAVAYDAAFEDLRDLAPLAKYRRRADNRHGGLTDLPADDAEAFAAWFHGQEWAGCHPWEIVFGHPHGIHLYPRQAESDATWDYVLTASTSGLYREVAQMAGAFHAAGVRFEWRRGDEVLAALRGTDDIEIGPRYPRLSLEMLRETRSDAVSDVRWDPIPELSPITADQLERVRAAEAPEATRR